MSQFFVIEYDVIAEKVFTAFVVSTAGVWFYF